MPLMVKTRETGFWAIAAVALLAWALTGWAQAGAARPYPEAEKLFQTDPRWLGGDDASSVEISPGRILWLFGDSFVAPKPPHVRAKAAFVHNTIAVQSGNDPRVARMTFYWRGGGRPAAFFADGRRHWYWPAGATRVPKGPLVAFLRQVVARPGQGLGFDVTGYALARIDNPDDEAVKWKMRVKDAPRLPFDVLPGSAVIAEPPYVIALATRQRGTHAGALVRYHSKAFARGDLSGAEWWMGEARGWTKTAEVGNGGPLFVMDDAGAECSVHWNAGTRRYVHVASYGFGAATIGVRTAAKLTGPWSAPRMVYRPPESNGPRPFVYAGKAHAELKAPGPGGLVISYVANSFEPEDLLTPAGERRLYWPRFAIVPRDGAR
jgi:hypothetical protein